MSEYFKKFKLQRNLSYKEMSLTITLSMEEHDLD